MRVSRFVFSLALCLAIVGVVTAAPSAHTEKRLPALRVQARIPIGNLPGGLVGAAGSLWAITSFPKEEVVQIDPATNRVVARLVLPTHTSPAPSDVNWITYAAGNLWVSRMQDNEVDRVSIDPLALVARVKITDPFDVAVAGASAFVPQFDPYSWAVIDSSSNTVVKTAPATGPTSAVFDDGAIWLLEHRAQELLRIDPGTNSVTKRIPIKTVGGGPERIAAGFGSIWATDPQGSVARIDEKTGKQLVEVVFPPGPTFNPYTIATGGGSVWVGTDHGVSRINPATNRITAALKLAFDNHVCGPAVQFLCVNGVTYASGSVWLSYWRTREIIRVSPR